MAKASIIYNSSEGAHREALRHVQTPRLSRVLTYWIGGIMLLLLLALFLPWTQNISSQGSLTAFSPEDRPQTVEATIAGRIEKWHIQEGQFVQKGDTIVSLSEIKEKYLDPNLLERIGEQVDAKQGAADATGQKVQSMREQIAALREGLILSLQKGRNKVEQNRLKIQSDSMDLVAQRTELAVAQSQFERQENLYNQGLKSLTELETRRLKLQEAQAKLLSLENKLASTKAELQNSRTELSSLHAEYADKIAKAEAELNASQSYLHGTQAEVSKLQSDYSSTQARNQYYRIIAPQDGYVVRTLKAGIGETIKEGEAVATIMPDDPRLAAELYVEAIDLPLVRQGDEVRLQFEGWPTVVFSGWPGASYGTFAGKVAVIDNAGINGKYRLLVVPDDEKESWPDALRVGSGVQGWAMLNTVPVWYELWRQLNGFPADYTGQAEADEKKKAVKEDEY